MSASYRPQRLAHAKHIEDLLQTREREKHIGLADPGYLFLYCPFGQWFPEATGL